MFDLKFYMHLIHSFGNCQNTGDFNFWVLGRFRKFSYFWKIVVHKVLWFY